MTDLIKAIDYRPDQFQFDICPDSNCWHTSVVWLRGSNTSLRFSLPSSPRGGLTARSQLAAVLDGEVARLSALPCFGAHQSAAHRVRRYMALLCHARFNDSDDPATQRKIFNLGFHLLSRLSVLLSEALTVVIKCWKARGHQRARNLSELAVLYFCVAETSPAPATGKVRPLIVSRGSDRPPPPRLTADARRVVAGWFQVQKGLDREPRRAAPHAPEVRHQGLRQPPRLVGRHWREEH